MNAPLSRDARRIRGVIAAAIFGFFAIFTFFPRLNPLPFCGFKALTGLPCPLCGGTRAAHAVLHGDITHAAYLNPLAILVIFLMLAVGVVSLIETVLGRPLANWSALWDRWHRPIPVALVAALLIWWPFHISFALQKPKTELINLQNPFAQACLTLAQGQKK
jgi:predicted membrane-bound mannosyltransferase